MALKADKNGGGFIEQAPIEPDVYAGRLVQIIDLGLQTQRPFKGQDKPPANEIMLTYELATEFMRDEEGNELEDKPRWVSEMLPFYGLFADKAKSTKRYLAFDPTQQFDGDFAKCVDIPVNITIVNNAVGDKVYTNVANVAAMSAKKAMQCPELKNPAKTFDLDEPDMEVFKALPKWIREKIVSNLNFNGSVLQKALGNAPAPKQAEKPEAPKADVGDGDNNPY